MAKHFTHQIIEAIEQLGPKEAASRMARALIVLAHRAGTDVEFTSDLGTISITRKVIPAADKH